MSINDGMFVAAKKELTPPINGEGFAFFYWSRYVQHPYVQFGSCGICRDLWRRGQR